MSAGTFTATTSYHQMLKRAQEVSPVLTYVLCALLIKAEEEKDHVVMRSERVPLEYRQNHPFSYYFMTDEMESFVKLIFHGITVKVSCSSQAGGADFYSRELIAHRQFVLWLKGLKLTFDDETQSVVIPA